MYESIAWDNLEICGQSGIQKAVMKSWNSVEVTIIQLKYFKDCETKYQKCHILDINLSVTSHRQWSP